MNESTRVLKPGYYIIDASTVLQDIAEVAPRIKKFYGAESSSLKIIVLLREPTSRDFSAYRHHAFNAASNYSARFPEYTAAFESFRNIDGFKTMSEMFSHNISVSGTDSEYGTVTFPNGDRNGSLQLAESCQVSRVQTINFLYGGYAQQLLSFMQYFDRSQLLVLKAEEVFADSERSLLAVFRFLGIPRGGSRSTRSTYPHVNHRGQANSNTALQCLLQYIPKLDCWFRDALHQYYAQANRDLECVLARTQSHSAEPLFEPFGDSYRRLSCVSDARAEFDSLRAKAKFCI